MQYKVIYSDSLAHHGILGQKWGVRRFQNEDGSYTAAGRERYGINGDKPKKQSRKADKIEKLSKAYQAHNPRMSKEKADKEAKKFINRKNALLIAGGALAVAGGAYALVRYKNAELDQTFDAGHVFHRVQNADYDDVQEIFYASTNERDRTKYVGMFGEKQNLFGPTGEYKAELTLKNKDELKVCGNKNAKKFFKEFGELNTDLVRGRSYEEWIEEEPIYDPDHAKAFFAFLQSKGYSGIIDRHDQAKQGDSHGSNFQAMQPVIFFGNTKSSMEITEKVQLDYENVEKNKHQAMGMILGDAFKNSLIPYSAVVATSGAAMGVVGNLTIKDAEKKANAKKNKNADPEK